MRLNKTICLVALCLSASLAGNAQSLVTEADDAYHFQNWPTSPLNLFYTEWWYFNLYDTTNDLQAIFVYQIIDPSNLANAGMASVTSAAFQGSNLITEFGNYPASAFAASTTAANVNVSGNTVSVASPDQYIITGQSPDGRLVWNLTYDRSAESWYADHNVKVANPAWEKMSWLLYMPSAQVSGTLSIDGQVYNVATTGYHDHNWGQFNFADATWNWAQYSDSTVAFDLGDFKGNPNGQASIAIAGKRVVFEASQYKLVHTKWAYDPVNRILYPVESVLSANNGTVQLGVTMSVQKTDPLGSGPPVNVVIYEQPTQFKGTVTSTDSTSPLNATFAGPGFKEYTAVGNPVQ